MQARAEVETAERRNEEELKVEGWAEMHMFFFQVTLAKLCAVHILSLLYKCVWFSQKNLGSDVGEI